MKDIAFIRPVSQVIKGTIKNRSTDQGLLLYQKIVLLVLSSVTGAYRQEAGTSFVQYLGRGNMADNDYMKALLQTACTQAKQCLDLQDSNRIESINVQMLDTSANITITLTSGEIYTGTIE